ncbi:MAG TPA: VOC family protein [Limnochordia bacterium]|nr:VOC family protein [Limnochordia bacterium]
MNGRKFRWATITVKDLEESIEFYRDIVGLSLNRRFPAGNGMEIAFLGDGGTEVELFYDPAATSREFGSSISLGFQVDSVEDMMNYVREKGFAIQSGPFQPNPQTKFFFVLDPNGLKIQFVEID